MPSLGQRLEHYVHASGAVHYHCASDDDHRGFMVSFRTPPSADTGLPHILEHTALCGSRRYPVRDPFFKMLKRSLQTFMNAMTFPDMTCFPFASRVDKDFRNLLAIYLDAVFRPLLDPLDFAQEGHRLERGPGGGGQGSDRPPSPDPQPPWVRKGVVFNEMKGAMDGTDAQLEAALPRVLLPDTCYRWNYGGEPSAIPALSHADLVAFHRRCYQPANACFTTYGNDAAESLHEVFAPYLEIGGDPLPPPVRQRPLSAPSTVRVPVPLAEDQDATEVGAARIAWEVGDAANLDEVLDGELLDRLLVGHAGAPLRRVLEASGLGRSIGSSGFSSQYRSCLFLVEIDGIDPTDHARFEPLVRETLAAIARDGVPAAEIAAALDQLELARREITGDQYPFGLELCSHLVAAWNHGGDPLAFLDQGPALARLRLRADGAWLQRMVRERLLDNPHHALLFAEPDADFLARAETAERAAVDADLARLDEAGRARLIEQARALAERQAAPEDHDILPELALADVPRERRWAEGQTHADGLWTARCGTNGILHQLVALPIPGLSESELDLLPLLVQSLGLLGVAGHDYAAWSANLNARCGGLWAWLDVVSD
ncbi:MAG: insulinase family protein, partial [Planctomycetes bacterium]|nr:insulinase family protein [Planctomycetota bacterium]